MDVVGYVDTPSVLPGELLTVRVSSRASEVRGALVRLRHGDHHPEGPGFKSEQVASQLDGTYRARYQPLRPGSYVRVEHSPALETPDGFTIAFWVFPTRLGDREQALVSKRDAVGVGWSAVLDSCGRLALAVDGGSATGEVTTSAPLLERVWYFVVASVDPAAGKLSLHVEPRHAASRRLAFPLLEGESLEADYAGSVPVTDASLLIAGAPAFDKHGKFIGANFNGKIANPRLFSRPLGVDEARRAYEENPPGNEVAAAWDFSQEISTRVVADTSANGCDGRTVNLPTRGVTGPNYCPDTLSFHEEPEQYGAIHFHEDDLDDAGWEPTIEWTVPEDLPSGVYAVYLQTASGAEDYVPFVLRPPRGQTSAKILLILPVLSYLAYGNEHLFPSVASAIEYPVAPQDRYIVENRLNSLYDKHSDGSGVCYSSWRRPIVNMRPLYHMPLLCGAKGAAHQFAADLYLVDWLEEKGFEFDVATDLELDREGAEALRPYRVVLTGTHAEYWTRQMLDGLEAYLVGGGRLMCLSGNGLYWVTGLDPEEGHTVEVRRTLGVSGRWVHEPGEGYLSTTGEQGGLWRQRGLAPQRYLGVGTSGNTLAPDFGRGAGYERQPGSFDPRVKFVFERVADGESIGDFPNLVCEWGAAGHEIDRADTRLGTPLHAVVLATASNTAATVIFEACQEEMGDPQPRADLSFFECPNGGAVFSAGSIAWCGSLSYNSYDNNVSRITENVLCRFLSPQPFGLPNSTPSLDRMEP